MPFIKINEINLYYEIYGQGDPLILITGLGQHHLSWKDFIKLLSKHFQVIAFDNRGSGQTEASEPPYSMKMLSNDVVALMEELGIKNAHFLGASMGCAVILQLCLDHPEKVKKGFLCAPFPVLPPVAKIQLRAMIHLLEKGVERGSLLLFQAAFLLSNAFLSNENNLDKFLQEALSDPYPTTTQGILGQYDALMKFDIREKLSLLPHEFFLLAADQDIITPTFCAKEIQEKAGQSTLKIVKGLGHFFWYEIPEKVCKLAITFFLKE